MRPSEAPVCCLPACDRSGAPRSPAAHANAFDRSTTGALLSCLPRLTGVSLAQAAARPVAERPREIYPRARRVQQREVASILKIAGFGGGGTRGRSCTPGTAGSESTAARRRLCGGLLEHGPRKLPFETALLIGFKWQIKSSEVLECTIESIPRKQKVRPCPRPCLAARRLPVRASPPLSDLTAARCSFCSSKTAAVID